jgi:hypothetical protein
LGVYTGGSNTKDKGKMKLMPSVNDWLIKLPKQGRDLLLVETANRFTKLAFGLTLEVVGGFNG